MPASLQSLFNDAGEALDFTPWHRTNRWSFNQSDRRPHAPEVIPYRSFIISQPVILITGALTGIGRATAIAFAKNGARLVVSGRRPTEGRALEAELQRLGAQALFIQADVRHDDEVRALVDQAVARFGRLDVAVNNAGTEGQPGLIINQTAESYAATFDTNVL